jgi:hypothetical protein
MLPKNLLPAKAAEVSTVIDSLSVNEALYVLALAERLTKKKRDGDIAMTRRPNRKERMLHNQLTGHRQSLLSSVISYFW